MDDTVCTYQGKRDEALIAHLYDEGDPAERAAFDAHLDACRACRAELAGLEGVQQQLGHWTPPEPARGLTFEAPPRTARHAGFLTTLADIPAWAQAGAALLFLGLAAGAANLDVRYDRDGLSVRTGWSRPTTSDVGAPATADALVSAPQSPAPWRAELTALEQQLRAELRAATTATERPARSEIARSDDVVRRLQTLIDQSERRQQRELALRVGEVLRDVQAQRQADLVRIDRSLGVIQNDTGVEVLRQRRMLNDLAVRVSQRQTPRED